MSLGTTRRRALVAPTLLGLVAAPLAVLATSAPAQAAGPGLVINEVYGGGGGGVATFENDFVELRNTSAGPITLTGKSLQFRGANSVVQPLPANVVALPDVVVPAGETFLVKGASASGSANPPGDPLPEPDLTTSVDLGGLNGQIFLADTTEPTNPNLENNTAGNTFDANVIDFVGYGTATSFEGAGPALITTAADSASRNAEGADTDSNATDFTAYEKAVEESSVGKELWEVRNTRQPFSKGFFVGGPLVNLFIATKGKIPVRLPWHRQDERPMFIGKTHKKYPKPDGKYTFDKLSSVFITGNATRDDAPNHIRVQTDVPREVAETWQWMCPAGVYEIPEEAPETGDVDVIVNYTNCVQCGAITAKGGRLTPPEGGDGPLYQIT